MYDKWWFNIGVFSEVIFGRGRIVVWWVNFEVVFIYGEDMDFIECDLVFYLIVE